jgi:hypothetical protein
MSSEEVAAAELRLLALMDEQEDAELVGRHERARKLDDEIRQAQVVLADLVERDDPARGARLRAMAAGA